MHKSFSHQNSKQQFENILSFLKEKEWIFNYPNTHILVNKVIDGFPEEWIHCLKHISNTELNNLPFGNVNVSKKLGHRIVSIYIFLQENWPSSLKAFLNNIEDLKCEIGNYNGIFQIPELPTNACISAKKQHEIVSLSAVVQSICKQYNISTVVDVGAGLVSLFYL